MPIATAGRRAGFRLAERRDDLLPSAGVIDETVARRFWPGQNPIGKHVMAAQSARGPDDQVEIVGIVRDVRDQSLATDARPAIYFS